MSEPDLERLHDIQQADAWRAKASTTLNGFLDHAERWMKKRGEADPTLRAYNIAQDLEHALSPDYTNRPLDPKYFAYTLAEAMYRLLEKDNRT